MGLDGKGPMLAERGGSCQCPQKARRGFLMSLEPAISLLMLLMLIILVGSHLYLPVQDYSLPLGNMHQTDLWLVNDSIQYYNQPQLAAQYEWIKKEISG
jgi:hypothetical protein